MVTVPSIPPNTLQECSKAFKSYDLEAFLILGPSKACQIIQYLSASFMTSFKLKKRRAGVLAIN